MEKLTFLAFIVIGTISSCKGCSPYTSVLRRKSSGMYGCGKRESVDVIFNSFKVKGNESEVVYKRVETMITQRDFATNGSEKSLSCDNFVACSKSATIAGYDAFRMGDEGWFGYKLYHHFLQCGDSATVSKTSIYARKEFVVKKPTVVPFDEAPYILLPDESVRQYMSAFIGTDPQGAATLVDPDINECGNTVKIPAESAPYLPLLVIYSHEGFGCTYYPSDLPDECTVTFEKENSTPTFIRFYSPTFDPENECEGLNMNIIASPGQSNEETKITCDPSGKVEVNGHLKYIISLQSHPSKRAVGFHAEIDGT